VRIKSSDSRDGDLSQLSALLTRQDISQTTRRRIEEMIRMVAAGARTQAEAEYQIEFRARDSRTVATIHDLRIEFNGWVAQIDHLLINRVLEIWVCESKSFAEGVRISEHGHWSAYYGGQPRGIPSPIEQNKRHMKVLGDLFASGLVPLPRRLGFVVKPTLRGVVLLSNSAQVDIPTGSAAARVNGLQTVMKSEELHTRINQEMDNESSLAALLSLTKVVSSETLERIARRLVALNVPSKQNWAARFGRSAEREAQTVDHPKQGTYVTQAGPRAIGNEPRELGSNCAHCHTGVSPRVADYCRQRPAQFGGDIYCMSCQPQIRRQVRASTPT
jgi:hypothetical protein